MLSEMLKFNKSEMFKLTKRGLEIEQILWETLRKPLSTSAAGSSQFKLGGQRRKIDPNRPAPHTLRNRKTLTYLGIALIATVAAPQVINDLIAYFEKPEEKPSEEK